MPKYFLVCKTKKSEFAIPAAEGGGHPKDAIKFCHRPRFCPLLGHPGNKCLSTLLCAKTKTRICDFRRRRRRESERRHKNLRTQVQVPVREFKFWGLYFVPTVRSFSIFFWAWPDRPARRPTWRSCWYRNTPPRVFWMAGWAQK